jgi:hypothetical protein
VPSQRRLVVQYIAGGLIVPTGEELSGTVGGQNAVDADDIAVPLAFSRESIGPTQDRLRAAQETLFYVEEGLTARVCMQPLPIGAPFAYFGKIVITGYVERS